MRITMKEICVDAGHWPVCNESFEFFGLLAEENNKHTKF